MTLRTLAHADLGRIISSSRIGGGWPVTVIAPDGSEQGYTAITNDVEQVIDPDTGMVVAGRIATMSLYTPHIEASGQGFPRGIAETSLRPWLVRFDDINGQAWTFKILHPRPDRTLGMITYTLEVYRGA